MAKAQRFQLTINSDLANLGAVADFVAAAAHASGLDERQNDHVQMAVDEAVTNVIQYAYPGQSDGRISIACERRRLDFVVEIQDFGKPFDPARVQTPRIHGPLSRRTVGGLGIFFMKKLMDRVEFSSDPKKGNRVRMVKHLQ